MTHFSEEAATRQALMGESLASGSRMVRGLSGIHTLNAAWGGVSWEGAELDRPGRRRTRR